MIRRIYNLIKHKLSTITDAISVIDSFKVKVCAEEVVTITLKGKSVKNVSMLKERLRHSLTMRLVSEKKYSADEALISEIEKLKNDFTAVSSLYDYQDSYSKPRNIL